MVKYKVNLKFKENGKSLNKTMIEVLKIKLEKKINMTCSILKEELTFNHIHYSQNEWSSN